MIDTLRLTAEEAQGLLARGEVSGSELFAAYRAAIDERDPELHCFLHLCDDPGGEGIPIALKDVISTKGVPTTAGSKILEGYTPVFDATVAARCKASGLRLLGKTNTDEFAMGSSTENSAYGADAQPVGSHARPGRLRRRVGGGGHGRARSVGARLGHRRLDQAAVGALRQRRAASDLRNRLALRRRRVRLVARPGRPGRAQRARLRAALLDHRRAGTSTTRRPSRRRRVELPSAEDLKGVRVGVPRELNEVEGIEPGVRAAVQAAIALAESLGAEVDECSLPLSVDYGLPCYYLVAPAEASSNLARYDGVRYGLRSDGADFREMVMNTRHDGFGDEPKRRIMIGTYALSSGYYDAYYGTAQKVRTIIRREHDAAFERFDVLVSPTSPTVAFPLGAKAADPLAMYLSDVLTIPSCMAGLPGLNVPCGLSDGLPVGLQLVGPQFSENALFRVGHALERAIGYDIVPERYRS